MSNLRLHLRFDLKDLRLDLRLEKNDLVTTLLLRKRVVLRYIFTSEVGGATKLTLIRKVFKYNRLWKLYERKLHFLHVL